MAKMISVGGGGVLHSATKKTESLITFGPLGAMPKAVPSTKVKTFTSPTNTLVGIGGPGKGKNLATLVTPTISVTEVPQEAGYQYYIAFYTWITSDGWFYEYDLPLHIFLEGVKGGTNGEIYEMDTTLEFFCDDHERYFFVQQVLPPNFFSLTVNASYMYDASSGWYSCKG